jgi:hypothetical protein
MAWLDDALPPHGRVFAAQPMEIETRSFQMQINLSQIVM